MAGVNFSRPLLGAGASAQCEFASAQARTGLDFTSVAQFKRGVKAELGVSAFADASAGLSKFISASVEGTAFARAQAGVQLQLPLNLFEEFGFSARAEAIAEAAAGVEVDIGLKIGDFVALVERDNIGLPVGLLLLLLEEVDVGGSFQIAVAAAAKAHASISVSGKVMPKDGEKAGFFYTIDAGAGLAAGVSAKLQVGAEFIDFRRFYGRAVDRVVDSVLADVSAHLPEDATGLRGPLSVLGPIAKVALRSAFEIGTTIATTGPDRSPEQAQTLCNEAIKVLLEEIQRFALGSFVDHAVGRMRALIDGDLERLGDEWDAARPQRVALADALVSMPSEPFQPTPGNAQYWVRTVTAGLSLLDRLYPRGANRDPGLIEAVTTLYCASELMLEAVRSKVNKASAYALAIGAGGVQVDTAPFKGPLADQPPPTIKDAIRSRLPDPTIADIGYPDLLAYLLNGPLLDRLLQDIPVVKGVVSVFKDEFGKDEREMLAAMLGNMGAFAPGAAPAAGASVDARDVLSRATRSMDAFLTAKITNDILPQLLARIEDPFVRLYLEEVVVAAVMQAKTIGLDALVAWEQQTFDNSDFTEALAAIMMLLLGRTVVLVGDAFLTATEEAAERALTDIADKIQSNDASVREITSLLPDAEARELVADAVRIGGGVLGPIEPDTRRRIRRLLYQVFEPLPPGSGADFLGRLADDLFIPNGDDLHALTDELAAVARTRFIRFAELAILRVGDYILKELEALIDAAVDFIVHWEAHLADTLDDLARLLREGDEILRRLNVTAARAFADTGDQLHAALRALSSDRLRNDVRATLMDELVHRTLDQLEDNDVYKALPSNIRGLVRGLAGDAVDALIDNAVVAPIFDVAEDVAGELDTLLPDFHALDPDDNLPEQVLTLILRRFEDRIRDHFGSKDPGIQVAIDFDVEVPLVGRQHVHIPLSSVRIPIGSFIELVLDVVTALDALHDAANAAALALARALASELEAAAARLRQDDLGGQRSHVEQITADHRAAMELLVLSPTMLADYRGTVRYRIHVGGAGASILGLKPDELEAPQLLVFVNGACVDLGAANVEIGPTYRSPRLRPDGPVLVPRPFFGPLTAAAGHAIASSMGSAAHASMVAGGTGRARVPTDTTIGAALGGVSPPIRLQTANVASVQGIERTSRVTVARNGAPAMVVHEVRPPAPGRIPAVRDLEALANQLSPGITLQFEMSGEPLVEGANVLTVVLIGEGGARQQQNVTFTVSQRGAAIQLPGRKGARRPVQRFTVNSARGVQPTPTPVPGKPATAHMAGKVLVSKIEKKKKSGRGEVTKRRVSVDVAFKSLRPADRNTLERRTQDTMRYLRRLATTYRSSRQEPLQDGGE